MVLQLATHHLAGTPSGSSNAYAFYVQYCRKNQEAAYPNQAVDYVKFIKDTSQKWDSMTPTDKAPFMAMEEEDKKRCEAAIKETLGHSELDDNKKKRKPETEGQIIRPKSAFCWFCDDERDKVKVEYPEYRIAKVAAELGKRWINAPLDVKASYETKAENDQMRYNSQLSARNKRNASSDSN